MQSSHAAELSDADDEERPVAREPIAAYRSDSTDEPNNMLGLINVTASRGVRLVSRSSEGAARSLAPAELDVFPDPEGSGDMVVKAAKEPVPTPQLVLREVAEARSRTAAPVPASNIQPTQDDDESSRSTSHSAHVQERPAPPPPLARSHSSSDQGSPLHEAVELPGDQLARTPNRDDVPSAENVGDLVSADDVAQDLAPRSQESNVTVGDYPEPAILVDSAPTQEPALTNVTEIVRAETAPAPNLVAGRIKTTVR